MEERKKEERKIGDKARSQPGHRTTTTEGYGGFGRKLSSQTMQGMSLQKKKNVHYGILFASMSSGRERIITTRININHGGEREKVGKRDKRQQREYGQTSPVGKRDKRQQQECGQTKPE